MPGNDQIDLTGLRELHRRARRLAGALSAAAAATAGEFTGDDETGVVEVTVDATGTPVRVRLDPDWRRLTGVAGLGPAVVDALTAASAQRLAAWAAGFAHPANSGGRGRPAPRPFLPVDATLPGGSASPVDPVPPGGSVSPVDPVPPGGPVSPVDPAPSGPARVEREIVELIDELCAHLASPPPVGSITATGPGGTVRVTASGGTVTAVDFADDDWLCAAPCHRVATVVCHALAGAVRDSAAPRKPPPGVDRARTLTSSPETLLREIGVPR